CHQRAASQCPWAGLFRNGSGTVAVGARDAGLLGNPRLPRTGGGALVGPLTDGEADQYYQDTKAIGVLLGIPRASYPEGMEDFEAYLREMIDSRQMAVGADATGMANLVLRPSFRGVPRLAFAPLTVITAGLLPSKLREGYGLKWGRAQRAAFAACRVSLPRLVKVAPEPVRWLPPARDAYRRIGM